MVSVGRIAEQNARLRSRVERLQRLLDSASDGHAVSAPPAQFASLVEDLPPGMSVPQMTRVPAVRDHKTSVEKYLRGENAKHRLVPFPGYANATAAELSEECIGISILGANNSAWQAVLRELQTSISSSRNYSYVVITDNNDFSYFIERGITFEYIGYINKLHDPLWQDYFNLNMELIKEKYGLTKVIAIGDKKYTS